MIYFLKPNFQKKKKIFENLVPRLKKNMFLSVKLLHIRLPRARTEWNVWTPLTIQYGVTVSHDSYVKCYAKAEVIGCNWNTQNPKFGHSDKDFIWTQI